MIHRIPANIPIQIDPALISYRVGLEEPAEARRVHPGFVIIDARARRRRQLREPRLVVASSAERGRRLRLISIVSPELMGEARSGHIISADGAGVIRLVG